MLDYIASKTAYTEYEERVRAEVPALEHDGWIRDHEPESLSKQAGRLLLAVGNRAVSMGEQLIGEQVNELAVSPAPQSSGARHPEMQSR